MLTSNAVDFFNDRVLPHRLFPTLKSDVEPGGVDWDLGVLDLGDEVDDEKIDLHPRV